LSAAIVALALTGTPAKADETYPNRPVRIVVSFSAGGPTDIVGRIFAQKLSELLGQQFYVENKVGAGGNIGADQVAKSAPERLHAPRRDGVDPRDQSRPLCQDAV
jgi:tripartite-type tricarboxylate transporter receptor subunit TctC